MYCSRVNTVARHGAATARAPPRQRFLGEALPAAGPGAGSCPDPTAPVPSGGLVWRGPSPTLPRQPARAANPTSPQATRSGEAGERHDTSGARGGGLFGIR
jgi:hypothetical protein